MCGKPVRSIIEGRFCAECGCPVHMKCMRPVEPSVAGCLVCGAKPEQALRELQLDQEDARTVIIPQPMGFFAAYQLVRFMIGGVVCGFAGIGLLFWEFSEPEPSIWAIARAVLLCVLGFGLVGALVWFSARRE
jgi:hypothetical protein